LMLAAVEHRFGPVNRLPITIEWLSDNGSCYLLGDAASLATSASIREPHQSKSPQSNGMAEALVRTIKRDYVRMQTLSCTSYQLGSITTTRVTCTRHSDIVHPVSSSWSS
jgi:transposase InsO family protein